MKKNDVWRELLNELYRNKNRAQNEYHDACDRLVAYLQDCPKEIREEFE